MTLSPSDSTSERIFRSRASVTVKTEMMSKMPMVMPSNESGGYVVY